MIVIHMVISNWGLSLNVCRQQHTKKENNNKRTREPTTSGSTSEISLERRNFFFKKRRYRRATSGFSKMEFLILELSEMKTSHQMAGSSIALGICS